MQIWENRKKIHNFVEDMDGKKIHRSDKRTECSGQPERVKGLSPTIIKVNQ